MNYYEKIYDINFFSANAYPATVGKSSVIVRESGIDWSTWNGVKLSSGEAKKKWEKVSASQSSDFEGADSQLLFLLVAEEAYRKNDVINFFQIIRFLKASEFLDLRLKAEKMSRAWQMLTILSNGRGINRVIQNALEFVNKYQEADFQDVKVEIPVRDDLEKKSYD